MRQCEVMSRPPQPEEGKLLQDALKRGKISQRQAARLAGISETRWRQIVTGYQQVSADVFSPVRGPATTVARMASAVGVTPNALKKAGRPDAAAELRRLEETAASPVPRVYKDPGLQRIWEITELSEEERRAAIAGVEAHRWHQSREVELEERYGT